MNFPFAHKPPRAKRPEPRRVSGRVRLRGEEMTELRRRAFERSGGRCEEIVGDPFVFVQTQEGPMGLGLRCNRPITWESMELSHDRHAANKSDTLEAVKASCKDCHQVGVHNPKPCPRKPGRVMSLKDGEKYWRGVTCFCGESKKSQETFCPNCRLELSPQTAEDIENTTGRDWCESVARAEVEILAAQRVESVS